MSEVTRLPVAYRRRRTVSGKEVWGTDEPSDAMVWEVCPYLRNLEPCQQCPRWKDSAYGLEQCGCFGLAAEACRIVMAIQKRERP